MPSEVEKEIAKIARARIDLAAARLDARCKARLVVLALEMQLGRALGGETLRGMPSLLPGRAYRAMRVRAGATHRGEPLGAEPDLILTHRGEVLFAFLDEGRNVVEDRAGVLEALLAEDLQRVVETILEAARSHLARCEQTEGGYRAVSLLARKMLSALEPGPEG